MKLNIPIEETIKKRTSVRTYEALKLTSSDMEKIRREIEQLTTPFGANVTIQIIEKDTNMNGEKLGTYGVIKGAKTYLGLITENTEMGLLAAGYQFENLILFATNMGLATVWLAATFSREQFEKVLDIKENQLFPAISPIGYGSNKKSLTESVMRKTMKSDQRKPWETLFYMNNFETVLERSNAGRYENALEMLRIAPSATNAQPWRVLKIDNTYHFFITFKSNTGEDEQMIKKVDLGIALSHFHQTALENNLSGHFEKVDFIDKELRLPPNTNYMISWMDNN